MILYEVFEIIACYIELQIAYLVLHELMHEHRLVSNGIPDIIMSIIGACIIRGMNYVSAFSYFTILCFALYVSVSAMFLYKVRYLMLISLVSFYLLCVANFDLFIFTLVSNIYGDWELINVLIAQKSIYRTIIILSIKILWIVLFWIVRKYLYSFGRKIGKGEMVIIVSILGFLGVGFLIEQTFAGFDFQLTGVAFLFMILCVLVISMLYVMVENREEKMKSNFMEMRNQLLEENYSTINNLYMNNAQMYHDLDNHMNILYQLLELEKVEEAKLYIDEISKPVSLLSKKIWTGMDVVDVVINSKLEKMKECNIKAKINVEFPQNTGIQINDICTILANLLDNAIEATKKVKQDKEISITIRRINNFIFIKIINPCLISNNIRKGHLLTTKENIKLHGWGIPSVKSAVEKYDGQFNYEIKGNEFIAKVLLCLKE